MNGPAPSQGPVADVRAAARACRARDYNETGVAMFLVLERVGGPAVQGIPTEEAARLAGLTGAYLAELGADPERPGDHALGLALEVLAAHHFAPR